MPFLIPMVEIVTISFHQHENFKLIFLCYSPIDLPNVLPRLWPYLDHSTSSVRKATLQTLRTLTRPLVTCVKVNGETNGTSDANNSEVKSNDIKSDVTSSENGEMDRYLNWTPELLQEAMGHVYQRVLFEHVHDIQEIAIQVRLIYFTMVTFI